MTMKAGIVTKFLEAGIHMQEIEDKYPKILKLIEDFGGGEDGVQAAIAMLETTKDLGMREALYLMS